MNLTKNRTSRAFCLLMLAGFVAGCGSIGKQDLGTVEFFQTPDGHEFSYHYMPDTDRAAISIAWKGGFAGVPEGKENVSALGPQLMADGGAGGKKPDEIREEFEALDAGARLYSDTDAIRGFIVAPVSEFPQAAAIANNVLAEPSLDSRWLARFKKEREKNILTERTFAWSQAWMTLRGNIVRDPRYLQTWSWHPLKNANDITIADVESWYKNSISSSNISIAVAGNASMEETAKAIDMSLMGLPASDSRENLQPLSLTFEQKTILVHRPDTEKSYLLMAGPLPRQNHPDDLAHALATGVLGQSEQSRLFKTVRGEQRAAYGFSANKYSFSRSSEVLALQGEIENEKMPQVIQAVGKAYEEFRSNGIGPVEFPIAKRIMLKRTREASQKPSTVAFLMTENELRGFEQSRALSLVSRSKALTRAAVNQAIAQNFPTMDQMVTVVVSPDRDIVEADCVISHFSEIEQCN